ncbi:MAG: HNH endonuclease [Magnetococcales bacterium]|nr:HNH endonuclease [Magnetococcales bacterium]MBF0115254.1 HNH endonuclease [Magnetococcales bacterium]
MDALFIPVDDESMARERRKAKVLKQSAWWKNCLARGSCSYCGKRVHPSQLTMDHKIPIVRGGQSTRSNCVPACQECNRNKENLPAEMWKSRLADDGTAA